MTYDTRPFDEVNRDLLRWIRRRAFAIGLTGACGAAVAFGASFLVAKRYTAYASYAVASSRNGLSLDRLAGFAAQLGITGAVANTESPDYFARVSTMREVKLQILRDTVCDVGGHCRTLNDVLFGPSRHVADELEQERRLKQLSKRMSVTVDPRTGVITTSASAPTPELAERILAAQLAGLSRFVQQKRESQARNERLFAEGRLKELQQKQQAVISTLTKFYESNRSFALSPALRFQEQELQAQLGLWQELVQSVARESELAHLDEVRDIPAITVLEQPYASRRKTAPRRSLWALAGFLIGALIGLRPDQFARRSRRAQKLDLESNSLALPIGS
jgi:capsule polysaccharide export protein KpsE/RkpR